MADAYEGPVCYQDGWHWSVVSGPDGDTPDKKLVLDDDGTYRFAKASDVSWHDRHHKQFVNVEPA